MSDKDLGQLAALRAIFPSTQVLLCQWHVIEAWNRQFPRTKWSEVHSQWHALLHINTPEKFNMSWDLLELLVTAHETTERNVASNGQSYSNPYPRKAHSYFRDNWMTPAINKLWPDCFRQGREIAQAANTNNYCES
jgi:hypothetical protein